MTTKLSARERLRRLAEQLRKQLARKHPITQQELDRVRSAARERWEKDKDKRAAKARKEEKRRVEKAREEERQKEEERKRRQQSQSHDQGHSH